MRDDVITLEIPGSSDWARLVRIAAASVADPTTFTVDDLERLRLAVGELVAVAAGAADAPARLRFDLVGIGERVDVAVTSTPFTPDVTQATIADAILAGVAHSHDLTPGSMRVCVTARTPTS